MVNPDDTKRLKAKKKMETEGAQGFNEKVTVIAYDGHEDCTKEYDLYVTLAWTEIPKIVHPATMGRLDYVDIRPGGMFASNFRAMVERSCKYLRALLRYEIWTLDTIIADWRGTRFEPEGQCPQLVKLEVNPLVKSPLDAIARVLEERRKRWDGR